MQVSVESVARTHLPQCVQLEGLSSYWVLPLTSGRWADEKYRGGEPFQLTVALCIRLVQEPWL